MSEPETSTSQGELYVPVIGHVAHPSAATITRVSAHASPTLTKLSEPLGHDNWIVWRDRMRRVLRLCGIEDYIDGKIPRPENAQEASNWDFNDTYAQVIIVNNVTSVQMVHVGQCKTACAMWSSLETVHDSKRHPHTITAAFQNLVRTSFDENTNISEHLCKLKRYRERINSMGVDRIKISDPSFKGIIATSLPPSWDEFTEQYVGGRKGTEMTDRLSSQEFIGILKQEHWRRLVRAPRVDSVNQETMSGKPLARRSTADDDLCDAKERGNVKKRRI
jgi:hypothetical protein